MKLRPLMVKIFQGMKMMKQFWKKDIDESVFQPAVLAIRESPPSTPARLVAYTLVVFFLAVFLWSLIGKLDVITVAHGKVIPAGHSKTIQSPESGIVAAILVQEGDIVAKGQLLIQLDDTQLRAESDRLQSEYWTILALLERNRLLLQLAESDDVVFSELNLPDAIPDEIKQRHQAQMEAQHEAFISNLEAKQASLQESIYTLQALRVEQHELEQQMPIVRRKLESVRALQEQSLASEHEFLQQEQAWISLQHRQKILLQKINALEMTVQRARTEVDAYQQSYRIQLLAEKEKASRKRVELEQQRIRLHSRLEHMLIRSPVAGRVERLSLHTVGAVVTAAQEIMSIVPENGALLIETYVQNKDIGFLRVKQQATVKVDAYPFTRFGTLQGEVLSISSDAFNAREQGWLFKMVVEIPHPFLEAQGRQFRLSPGMSAQVEIRTGERRILDYFLSPFQVKISESLTER